MAIIWDLEQVARLGNFTKWSIGAPSARSECRACLALRWGLLMQARGHLRWGGLASLGRWLSSMKSNGAGTEKEEDDTADTEKQRRGDRRRWRHAVVWVPTLVLGHHKR